MKVRPLFNRGGVCSIVLCTSYIELYLRCLIRLWLCTRIDVYLQAVCEDVDLPQGIAPQLWILCYRPCMAIFEFFSDNSVSAHS